MTEYFTPISFKQWPDDKRAFADALGRSFRETGFAVISDHPISQGVIERAIAASKAFFELPEDVKENYHDAAGGRQRGYTPFGTENAKGAASADLKEFWHTGRALPEDSPYRATMKQTPAVPEVAEFDEATRDFYEAMDAFGAQLLQAMPDLNLTRLKSGPLGGDQQLGAMICEERLDALFFFVDPLAPMPHDVDIKALTRLALVYDLPLANSPSTADFVMMGLCAKMKKGA